MTREYTFTTSRTSALDWEMRRGRRIRSSAPSRLSKALWQPSHLVLMKKGITAPLVFSSATMEFQVSVHTSDLGVRPSSIRISTPRSIPPVLHGGEGAVEPLATSTCREGMKLRATTRSVLRGLVCLVDTAEQQVV